jgi:hypothetical protein
MIAMEHLLHYVLYNAWDACLAQPGRLEAERITAQILIAFYTGADRQQEGSGEKIRGG